MAKNQACSRNPSPADVAGGQCTREERHEERWKNSAEARIMTVGKTLRSTVKHTRTGGKSGVYGLPLEKWLIFHLNTRLIRTPPLLPSNRPLGLGKRSHGPVNRLKHSPTHNFPRLKKKYRNVSKISKAHENSPPPTHKTCEIYYTSIVLCQHNNHSVFIKFNYLI